MQGSFVLVCFLVTKRLWALVAAKRIECGGPWSDSLWLLLVTTSSRLVYFSGFIA